MEDLFQAQQQKQEKKAYVSHVVEDDAISNQDNAEKIKVTLNMKTLKNVAGIKSIKPQEKTTPEDPDVSSEHEFGEDVELKIESVSPSVSPLGNNTPIGSEKKASNAWLLLANSRSSPMLRNSSPTGKGQLGNSPARSSILQNMGSRFSIKNTENGSRALATWKKVKLIGKLNMKKPDPINVQTTQQAINLIYDKAFSIYKRDLAAIKAAKRRKYKQSRLKSILERHAIYTNNRHSQALAAAMEKIKYLRKNIFQRMHQRAGEKWRVVKKRVQKVARTYGPRIIRPWRPEGVRRFIWEVLLMIFIMHDLIVLPVILCFDDDFDKYEWMNIVDKVESILFLADILLNFHTAITVEGRLIYDHKQIMMVYLKKWFWIDLVASFPYTWVTDAIFVDEEEKKDGSGYRNTAQFLRIIRLLRFSKILRMIRIAKLKRILGKFESFIQTSTVINGILSLAKLSIFIFFLAHWCACIWYLIGTSNSSSFSWLERSDLEGASFKDRYVASLYFAITTMLTVGYGDIIPVNANERVISIFMMILGGGVFGYLMNSIAMIAKSIEGERGKAKKAIYKISRFMQRKGLTKDIQARAKKYLEFTLDNDDGIKLEESAVLDELSSNLKQEVYKQINGKFLSETPIFNRYFSRRFLHQLSRELNEKSYSPGEIIFDQNTELSVYFIAKGTIDLSYPGFTQSLETHEKGGYFGELSFFKNFPASIVARSKGFSHILFLRRSQFDNIVEKYELDKEAFHMLKDKLSIYNDYNGIEIQCQVCHKDDHTSDKCRKIHFVASTSYIINHYLMEEREFRSNYQREGLRSPNTYLNLKDIQDAVKRIQKSGLIPEVSNAEPKGSEESESEDSQASEVSGLDIDTKKVGFIFPSHLANGRHPEDESSEEGDDPNNNRCSIQIKRDSRVESSYITNHRITYLFQPNTFEYDFDKVHNFQFYFPHNNIAKILDNATVKKKVKVNQMTPAQEAEHLRIKLGKFFSKKQKQKNLFRAKSKSDKMRQIIEEIKESVIMSAEAGKLGLESRPNEDDEYDE